MPTYEYECRACKRSHEVRHAINDPAPVTCEVCGGDLRRVFFPPGLVFKGTGFYSTEGRFGRTLDKRESYKKDEAKAGAGASKDSAAASSSQASGSKPSGSKNSAERAGTEKSA